MTNYIDTYIVCSDLNVLSDYCQNWSRVIWPAPGRAAVPAGTDPQTGNPIQAQPAAGDPSLYYACIRATFAITPPAPVQVIDTATGQLVVGVWA